MNADLSSVKKGGMSMSSKSGKRGFRLFKDSTIGFYYGRVCVVRGDIFDVLKGIARTCNEEKANIAREELFDFLGIDPVTIE